MLDSPRYRYALVAICFVATAARAQTSPPSSPQPTHADIAYAPPDPATSKGHLLDLYLLADSKEAVPLVIFTGGSAVH